MPSTRAVRDGNELYYMTQNRYASNMSDLDVKVASNDESTIQVKNDGDYIYTIATAPKLKNNLVMYQKHSGKFAGEIHCEAEKDNTQAQWLCETAFYATKTLGEGITSGYIEYMIEGPGTGLTPSQNQSAMGPTCDTAYAAGASSCEIREGENRKSKKVCYNVQ